MKSICILMFFSIVYIAGYPADVQPTRSAFRVVPFVLSLETLEQSGVNLGSPTWVEVQFLDGDHGVFFSEIAEKVWWFQHSAVLLIGSTGKPLPERLFQSKSPYLVLSHKGRVLTKVTLDGYLAHHCVSIKGEIEEIQDALMQAIPGFGSKDVHEIAFYCSTRCVFQEEQVVRATSYEVANYGTVITNDGSWMGVDVKAQGVVTGNNNKSYLIPKGAIIGWSGSLQSQDEIWHPLVDGHIDTNWALCDGSGGTLDLRNRLILGAGDEPTGMGGGQNLATLSKNQIPEHFHHMEATSNVTSFRHSHEIFGMDLNRDRFDYFVGMALGNEEKVGGYTGGFKTYDTAVSGNHAHRLEGETSYIGGTQAIDIRPPYFSIAFLQYIGQSNASASKGEKRKTATPKKWILPLKLPSNFLGDSQDQSRRDQWFELEYSAFPNGPVLHVEPAEKLWRHDGKPMLLLGATGQLLPEEVAQRSSVYITIRMNSWHRPIQVFPRSQRVWADASHPSRMTKLLSGILDNLDAVFLSEITNFEAGFAETLNAIGTRLDGDQGQPLIDSNGHWVGGAVATRGNINANNLLDLVVPKGAIIMWSGIIDANGHPLVNGSPVQQWHECDGSSTGIPDLRNKFVVGLGSGTEIGHEGGAKTQTLGAGHLPAHFHSFQGNTENDGEHSHNFSDRLIMYLYNPLSMYLLPGLATILIDRQHTEGHYYDNPTSEYSGSHQHTLNANTHATGSSSPIDIIPTYYSLAYLICTGD